MFWHSNCTPFGMLSKTQLKGAIFKIVSLPAFKNIVILLGVVVAMLVGFFTLQASSGAGDLSFITLQHAGTPIRVVEAETLEVESMPQVIVYDKNFDLVLLVNPGSISAYEKEHLNRLLHVCDLLFTDATTTVYQLDK